VLDACDILAGTTPDLNGNGIPDSCDPDCNINGTPDFADIAAGTSPDCDDNGVPDECQDDTDGDGLRDVCDNCPEVSNPDQSDTDEDAVGDACDNCPDDANPDQCDLDADDVGYACEPPAPTAMEYGGLSEVATIPDHEAFHFGEGDFTVEMWLQAFSSSAYLFDKRTGVPLSRIGICFSLSSNGYLGFELDYPPNSPKILVLSPQ